MCVPTHFHLFIQSRTLANELVPPTSINLIGLIPPTCSEICSHGNSKSHQVDNQNQPTKDIDERIIFLGDLCGPLR